MKEKQKMQTIETKFVDLLKERRKDCDIMWVSRSMKPLTVRKLGSDVVYTRKQMIEAVLSNNRVLSQIYNVADTLNVPVSTIATKAQDILLEMACKANLPIARWIGLLITKILKRILISIRLNESSLYQIRNQMLSAEIQYVYAPTHRSYFDFVLLSYIFFSYDMALPNIASGMDFYQMKIVGELLRHTGAFYMRRSFSSDPLYKEIFRAYVNSLVAHSDRAIEFFIEGTRSRNQKTLAPKFGLLSTILEGLYRSNVPDIQFIPISISYDKPIEELLFVYELLGVPKPAESTSGLFRSLSVLRKPFTYGHVYVKIASPISAHEYVNSAARRASALSPHAKLPPQITEKLAHAIIDCHKRNTILTPFNLVSLLYNERIYSLPKEPYSLDSLLRDYSWIKTVFINNFNATITPALSNIPTSSQLDNLQDNADKCEVLESLRTHKDLMEIDLEENLRLKSRHVGIAQLEKLKGHPLREETLKLAVPVINLMIYVNPVFAYLSKLAIVAASNKKSSEEQAIKRYIMLRSLFSLEFALPTNMTELELKKEWKEITEFLIKENIVNSSNEDSLDSKNRLYSILCNLLTPFIASLYIICKILLQWEVSVNCVEKNVIKECQRCVEESLYLKSALVKHPYSLSLDIYSTLLSSLVMYGNVDLDKQGFYKPKKLNLELIVIELDDILKQCLSGSYLEIFTSIIPDEISNLQAKL